MEKPDVDSIEGLSPAISIDQKTTSRNPRSTVGTVTEIYDYLRLLFARVGHPHCHVCGRPIAGPVGRADRRPGDGAARRARASRSTRRSSRGRKGEFKDLFESLRGEGFTRVKVDGETRLLEEGIELDKKFKHDIAVVVDRLVMKDDLRKRLADSVETALALAEGLIDIAVVDGETDSTLLREASRAPSTACRCPSWRRACSRSTRRTAPARRCHGLGATPELDPDLIVPDAEVSISDGALLPWNVVRLELLRERASWPSPTTSSVDLETPWGELPDEQRKLFLYGTGGERVYVTYKQPPGPQAPVHDGLRGHHRRASTAATARPSRRCSASASRST